MMRKVLEVRKKMKGARYHLKLQLVSYFVSVSKCLNALVNSKICKKFKKKKIFYQNFHLSDNFVMLIIMTFF